MVKRGKGRSRARGRSGGIDRASFSTVNPPQVNSTPRVRRRFQFTGLMSDITNNSIIITRQCLLSLLCSFPGSSATVAQTVTPIYAAVLLRRIMIHVATVSTSGSSFPPNTVFQAPIFEWLSDLGPLRKTSRLSMTPAVPTRFAQSPPPKSRAAMWSRASATTASLTEPLFSLTIPEDFVTNANAYRIVITLDCDCMTDDAENASVTSNNGNLTFRGIFGLPLDNLTTSSAIGSGTFVPVGIQMQAPWSTQTTWSRSG